MQSAPSCTKESLYATMFLCRSRCTPAALVTTLGREQAHNQKRPRHSPRRSRHNRNRPRQSERRSCRS
eukprot:3773640-Rhodomonas_salina.2